MSERTSVIKVGDTHHNSLGEEGTVLSVVQGKIGTLLCVDLIRNNAWTFLIPELEPIDRIYNWYGWRARGRILLPNGSKIAAVSFDYWDKRKGIIEEHEAEWLKTIEAMRQEEMGCVPTEHRVD